MLDRLGTGLETPPEEALVPGFRWSSSCTSNDLGLYLTPKRRGAKCGCVAFRDEGRPALVGDSVQIRSPTQRTNDALK
jgi:hypothetical protein